MIKARAKRTIDQWVPVPPRLAGQTVRCERSFSLGLVDNVLQALGVVRLGQSKDGIRFVKLLPAPHDFTMRRMIAAQHVEAAFKILMFAIQPGDIGARWKKAFEPIRVDWCMGDDVGVSYNQNIRFEIQRRVRHGRDLVGEAHAIESEIVFATAESVRVRVVSVPRFELGEPGRQSSHDRPPGMIRLKIFGIKIEGEIGRPEFIEGFHHPAAILFPSCQIAGRNKSESHQSITGKRPKKKRHSLVVIAHLFNLNLLHLASIRSSTDGATL